MSGSANQPSRGLRGLRLRGVVRVRLLALLVLVGALAAGCANGTYPLDFFYEMHYQQSYSSHEPPRLSVPRGAVPISGSEVPFETLTSEEIDQLTNPFLTGNVREGVDEGEELFAINCALCHGPALVGDGEVLNIMREDYGYQVKLNPDLTSLGGLTDQTLFGIISDRNRVFPGIEGWVMPQFRRLLTAEERWMIVNYIRSVPPPPDPCRDLAGAQLGECEAERQGCTVCHSIDGTTLDGPTWKGLHGAEETLADGTVVIADDIYLIESIVDPDAKIVEGFPSGRMPPYFGDVLSEQVTQAIVEYIKTLK